MTVATGHARAGGEPGGRRHRPVAAHWQGRPALTLLVADPDPQAASPLSALCDARDIHLVSCSDGATALLEIGRLQPEVILLGAPLPVVSRDDVVKAVHGKVVSHVVLGIGDGDVEGAAAGLAAGAAGLVSRPYLPSQLEPVLGEHVASTRARRAEQAVLTVGALHLDPGAFRVRAAGRSLALTLREFELLRVLMLHPGQVVDYAQIRSDVWGEGAGSGKTIAVHVRRLRTHLEGLADIVSVRGVGYRLVAADRTR